MMFDYTPTGAESAHEEEPLWKCLGCLTPTPKSQWEATDGLCGKCGDEPWPRVLEQLPT
jgi:hypothetical protein